jgi:uncharacterized membrane protein YphA (DoxX/SURF4 family)
MVKNINRTIWIIRIIPGLVFLLEGIQKFTRADSLGVGRFMNIGIPHAAFWGPFVGVVEIVCGSLLLIGLFARLATIPLIIDMICAFIYTKWPILVDKGFFPMFHDYRTDFAMTLCLVFLLMAGPGYYALDNQIHKPKRKGDSPI